MLQISKRVEYALIAVRHLAVQPLGTVVTAKDLAEHYHISFELMAKVLQRLTKEGLLSSLQGVKGGYALSRKPGEIPLLEILNAIEGKPNVAVVQCEAENPETCSIHSTCTIRSPLVRIQDDINSIFQHMTVSQLVSS